MNRGESLICRALVRYGYSIFKLEILEYCKPEQCREREQHYLDNFPHEYNLIPTAGSCLGLRRSEATRQKMSEAVRKTWLKKDQAAREKALANLVAATAARSKAVLVKNTETGESVEYISQSAAARALGVGQPAISNCLKRKNLLNKTFEISLKSSD